MPASCRYGVDAAFMLLERHELGIHAETPVLEVSA
jgi:hypothetical protein